MKKFMVGVGIYRQYDAADNLLFESKTMSTSGIEISTENVQVRGGQGNGLQFTYFHSGAMSLTLTETQWNLGMIAANVGSSITTGAHVWTEEDVTLGSGGTGTVEGTPLVTPDASGSTIYGWADQTKITFSGSNFTLSGGQEGQKVCVRYYANNVAARKVQINANFIPTIGRAVIDTQLASSEGDISSGNIIGRVQVEIPRCQLSGSQNLEMSADGVSNTPLTANALVYETSGGGCSSGGYYATITEILNSANWWDEVIALSIANSDIEVEAGNTETLSVFAIPSSGSAFIPPYADLTFASVVAGTATVDASGVVTGVSAGTTNITASITEKTSIQAVASVEVTSA